MHVAADACLQNPIVVQKILKYHSPNSMENLELRLINTLFNTETLHRIRRTHRNIRIKLRKTLKFVFGGNRREPVDVEYICVNSLKVKTERILAFLNFLNNVANVKVEHCLLKNFWAKVFSEELRKKLHDVIHTLLDKNPIKTFVGMSEIDDGFCRKCHYLAASSSQYGPFQIGITSDSFGYKRHLHFQKLIVGERCLHGIASNMFMYLPEDRKKFIKHYVDPLISCDKLCFKFDEIFDEFPEKKLITQPLPLEIIEEMCDVWKAKSIEIEYNHGPVSAETWPDDGILTPLRFDELHQETDIGSDKRKRKFSSVKIDMKNTRFIYSEAIDGSIELNESYSNLIGNVRRVFQTDKIIIIGPQNLWLCGRLFIYQESFENILKSVWKNPGHLEVTIIHYCPSLRYDDDFEVPDSIVIMGQRLKCTLLPERLDSPAFTKRTFRITDEFNEKTLHLELFLNTFWLELFANGEYTNNKTPLENGLYKHYY